MLNSIPSKRKESTFWTYLLSLKRKTKSVFITHINIFLKTSLAVLIVFDFIFKKSKWTFGFRRFIMKPNQNFFRVQVMD